LETQIGISDETVSRGFQTVKEKLLTVCDQAKDDDGENSLRDAFHVYILFILCWYSFFRVQRFLSFSTDVVITYSMYYQRVYSIFVILSF
jgi:hypothetical protein